MRRVKPDFAKLKADAIISADKAKNQIYCQIGALGDQIDQEEDRKKAEALLQKMNELGPEYVAFVQATKDVDPDSKDAQDIVSMFDELDEACPD